MNKCRHCDQQVPDQGVFCQFCGGSLRPAPPPAADPPAQTASIICLTCRTVNPAGTNFCFSCGRKLLERAEPSARARPASAEVDVQWAPERIAAQPPPPAAVPLAPPVLVVVRRDGTDGQSYPITRAQFDIGRTEGDLLFDDPLMAARHARIVDRGGSYIIAPLETRNGIYLRIHDPVDLTDGDHLLIGKQVLRFELLADVERTLRPAVEHGVTLFGTPVKTPWGRLKQMTSAGTCRDVFHLARSEVVLGREQGDIVFADDEFLSRRHAQFDFQGVRVVLQDLGSSNGTFLRLRAQHALVPGEMIRMGDELLRFDIR